MRPGVAGVNRAAITILLAAAIAMLAFLLRFNALGGALGGFDNDEFFMLTRADAILDGEQPLRDFADAELRAVWPSLSYQIPAWSQQLWGRNLAVYATLVCGALALSASIVFLAARAIAGGWVLPVLAALAVIASYAKPYNYPKPLTLGAAILLLWWAILRPAPSAVEGPTKMRIALLAAWTVVAGLFRHDYGVYVGVAFVVGLLFAPALSSRSPDLVSRGSPDPVRSGSPDLVRSGAVASIKSGIVRVVWYAGFALVFALPSLVWLAIYKGIPSYLTDVLESIRGEGRRLVSWPAIDPTDPFRADSLIAFNYYLFWLIPIVATGLLVASWWRRGWGAHHALGLALVLMTFTVDYFFLRGNLPARFGDAVVAVALLVVWMAALASRGRGWAGRFIAPASASAVLVAMIAAFFPFNSIAGELTTGGFIGSETSVVDRRARVSELLREQPPRVWADKPREGSMAVARYVAECTAPEDRVLVGTLADEIPYFARRHFAAGQAAFYSNWLLSEDNQRLALERLARQSAPVMVTHPDYHGEFEVNYRLVARYVAEHYREVGLIEYDGRPLFRVYVETARQPVRTDPVLGYPCFQ